MHIPHENEESNFGMEGTKVTEYIMYVESAILLLIIWF